MATLTIGEQTARGLYPSAAPEFKAIMEETFGKSFFSQKITDRIKTFEDACKVLHIDPNDVGCTCDSPDEMAYKKLKIIIKALNEGWTPDWKDENQAKYYPWFYMDKGRWSPSGFSFGGANWNCTTSCVGSRLCFKSRELCEYAAKQFIDLYKQYFTY